MEIEIGKYSGFCAGVAYTVNKAIEILENSEKKVYCLGEIVHNEKVVKTLEKMGMITVNNIEDVPKGSTVIFRAHGESKETYKKAELNNIKVIDLACGKVKVIRNKIEKEKEDSFIIIIGKKEHPETKGNISFAGNNSYIIEEENDIYEAYKMLKQSDLDKVFIVAQTTFSSLKFDDFVKKIKDIFKDVEIKVDKTICDATEKRQKEALEISKRVDKVIIIGGKHSSNTKELAKIAETNCNNSILIQTVKELENITFDKEDRIGILAGASTPKESIEEVVEYIKSNL